MFRCFGEVRSSEKVPLYRKAGIQSTWIPASVHITFRASEVSPQTKQSFSGRCAWDNSLLSVFFLEPTYATFRIEDTLFSSEERMRRR